MTEEKVIKETTKELLNLLGFKKPEITIRQKEDRFLIDIQVEDQGVLIGFHGETVNALQLILSLILYHKQGKWQPVLLDIGDYRKEQEERLKNIALNTAQKVKFSQKPTTLTGLKSYERRIIHLALVDHPDVKTESQGEGSERELVVYPATPKDQRKPVNKG